MGADIQDTVVIEGSIPEGSKAKVELFFNESGQSLTCDHPIWTSNEIVLTGPGEYVTNKYKTTKYGVYHFREGVYNDKGELIAQGKCGVPNETITFDKTPVPGVPYTPRTPGIPRTGISEWLGYVALAAFLVTIMGGALVYTARRRDM